MVNFFIFSVNDKKSVVYGLLRRFTPRNDSTHKLVIARVACNSWQSWDGALWQLIKIRHCENLPHTLSLREPKVRGNPLIY